MLFLNIAISVIHLDNKIIESKLYHLLSSKHEKIPISELMLHYEKYFFQVQQPHQRILHTLKASYR